MNTFVPSDAMSVIVPAPDEGALTAVHPTESLAAAKLVVNSNVLPLATYMYSVPLAALKIRIIRLVQELSSFLVSALGNKLI